MLALLQRVSSARVLVDGAEVGRIGPGLLVLLGVLRGDGEDDVDYLVDKTCRLRIFDDEAGKMNLSLLDTRGALLLVSQFTLAADCRKGRRPSYHQAAPPAEARSLYHRFAEGVRELGLEVATGRFGAMMDVRLCNQGPVTILLDSRLRPGR